jgi:hypothetical protein
LRVIAAGLLHLLDVRFEILLEWVPVVVIVARHRIVFGKSDFREAETDSVRS